MDAAIVAIVTSLLTTIANKLPEVFNSRSERFEKKAQREHEIRMRKYETLTLPRVNAILKYCEVLGKCMAVRLNANPEGLVSLREEYYRASASVYPYVSSETQAAIADLDVPFEYEFSDEQIQIVNARLMLDLQRLTEEI